MPWGIAAAVAAPVISSAIGAGGSEIAGGQGAAGNVQAANLLSPYASSGQNALNSLVGALGIGPNGEFQGFNPDTFQGSPGYQFQLNQGIDAIQNSAAARGGVVSGNTLKALQSYGQGLANQDWYNYLSQLYGLTRLGSASAAGQGQFLVGAGNANASGTAGATKAIQGGIGGLGNALSGVLGSTGSQSDFSTIPGYAAGGIT